jgi:hypothetical protein
MSHHHRTTGESLSCLVGASITMVGNTIYVLGGFDRYSDEVFNTLYALKVDDGHTLQEPYCWRRLDYAPSTSVLAKRNDHTATLWGTDKLVVFGGTGEEEDDDDAGDHFYTQVAILDLPTLTWEHPTTTGGGPSLGRIKHSATIYQDKLYISGGLDRHDHVADTVLVLNLLTYEWLPPLPFVPRSQHMTFIYNRRLYLFGGYHPDMSRSNVLAFLDLDSTSVTQLEIDSPSAPPLAGGEQFAQICGDQLVVVVATGPPTSSSLALTNYATNSSSDIGNDTTSDTNHYLLPRSSSSCSVPGVGHETGLWTLDLTSMQWQYRDITAQLMDGVGTDRHWQYFSMAEHGNRFLLFGATDDDLDEYYATALQIHLKEHGIVPVPPSQLGTDLAGLLLSAPLSTSATADFTLLSSSGGQVLVHRLVLLARWPHFAHLMNSGMVESLGNSMTLPEPLGVIQGFVHFLYTDCLPPNDDSATLVADLMVMANLYLLPRLLALCVRQLYSCLCVDSVAKIYQAALDAGQDALAKVALSFLFAHFGQVVHTQSFRRLPPTAMARVLDQVPFFSSILVLDPADVPPMAMEM